VPRLLCHFGSSSTNRTASFFYSAYLRLTSISHHHHSQFSNHISVLARVRRFPQKTFKCQVFLSRFSFLLTPSFFISSFTHCSHVCLRLQRPLSWLTFKLQQNFLFILFLYISISRETQDAKGHEALIWIL